MVRVLVCDHVEIERLSLGPSFEVDYRPALSREELLSVAGNYEVLVVRSRTKVDREVLERANRLKLVARPGTGLDNVDVGFAKERGVAVVNSPESLVEAVAEQVVMVMLALSRKLIRADTGTRSGKWEKNGLVGREMKGKVLGVVGFGRIGRRIAEVGKALGMSTLAYDVISVPPDVLGPLSARMVSLDELFSSSDYITLHVPLTPETAHMVDASRIARMKDRSVLVNMSRGGVVDEDALASALREGRLGGAALDVFEKEPPSGAILSAPNAILTPHIGGQTEEAQENAIEVVGEKVRAFFKAP
ncbi:MAG: hydroxyacid dehydrogenase [Nitrososphaerota archaeon]|jgi:D-3-phosphoglycerate dehydrogenase|nr:hydroxyacid dehydrogenase [Nitrososphaerota archaeon]MDG6903505.1 hydroxyacid dehydrogenase [Nitrososphaerota archaeon]MDG6912020.1 hydroxyacid dehydrogenase [Nitrososphaerota archaeon]MDG6924752.1 hydroxyacid dehydrogenase [Nitrososphaerota archaeon]MDG6940885.1 hydroxyacid dehydrogenase [Nitrososphaerota archaeon]